jgi:hypothetical protein
MTHVTAAISTTGLLSSLLVISVLKNVSFRIATPIAFGTPTQQQHAAKKRALIHHNTPVFSRKCSEFA